MGSRPCVVVSDFSSEHPLAGNIRTPSQILTSLGKWYTPRIAILRLDNSWAVVLLKHRRSWPDLFCLSPLEFGGCGSRSLPVGILWFPLFASTMCPTGRVHLSSLEAPSILAHVLHHSRRYRTSDNDVTCRGNVGDKWGYLWYAITVPQSLYTFKAYKYVYSEMSNGDINEILSFALKNYTEYMQCITLNDFCEGTPLLYSTWVHVAEWLALATSVILTTCNCDRSINRGFAKCVWQNFLCPVDFAGSLNFSPHEMLWDSSL